jgi:hypothetical protein
MVRLRKHSSRPSPVLKLHCGRNFPPIFLLALQDEAVLDDVIDRLLEVRNGRPGKQVALTETEVSPGWLPRIYKTLKL